MFCGVGCIGLATTLTLPTLSLLQLCVFVARSCSWSWWKRVNAGTVPLRITSSTYVKSGKTRENETNGVWSLTSQDSTSF